MPRRQNEKGRPRGRPIPNRVAYLQQLLPPQRQERMRMSQIKSQLFMHPPLLPQPQPHFKCCAANARLLGSVMPRRQNEKGRPRGRPISNRVAYLQQLLPPQRQERMRMSQIKSQLFMHPPLLPQPQPHPQLLKMSMRRMMSQQLQPHPFVPPFAKKFMVCTS